MSFVKTASGGDGWAKWTVTRDGDNMLIEVTSNAEQEPGETPSGWQPRVLHSETMRDETGVQAIYKALGVANLYGDRMAS